MKKVLIEILYLLLSVSGVILSLCQINKLWGIVVVSILGFLLLVDLIVQLIKIKRTTIKKGKRVKQGEKFIENADTKVVLYGGDLSWVEDYLEVLKCRIKENCTVEVFFDSIELNKEAQHTLQSNIRELKNIGCIVYKLNQNYGLRCIISDPENQRNKFKVWTVTKVSNNANRKKRKYITNIFDFNNEKMIANLFKQIYSMTNKEDKV